MKVLTFLVADFSVGGGGERVAANQANYFASTGDYKVQVVSITALGEKSIYGLRDDVRLVDLGLPWPAGSVFRRVLAKLTAFRRVWASPEIQQSDLLFGIGTFPSVVLGVVGKVTQVKIGCEHLSYLACPRFWSILRRVTYPHLDVAISLTENDRVRLDRFCRRTETIPNCRSFYPDSATPSENKRLLCVARLTKQKGVDMLLEVFARVNRERPDWELRLIGDGPQQKEVVEGIKQRGLEASIEMFTESSAMEQEYQQAAIYLLTSRWEGLPMVLLEAQACGLPVVAFDCETGPSEVICDGRNGYLVPPLDTVSMAVRVLELIDHPEVRKEFSEQSRIDSEKFSPEVVNRQWDDLIRNQIGMADV